MTVHHTISPNTVLAPPDNDILRTPAPQEMLRVAWNIAWSGGFEEMLELLKSGGTKLQELGQYVINYELFQRGIIALTQKERVCDLHKHKDQKR